MDRRISPTPLSNNTRGLSKAELRRRLRVQLGTGPAISPRILDLLDHLGAAAVASYEPLPHELNVTVLNDTLAERSHSLWLPAVGHATGPLQNLPLGFRLESEGVARLDICLDAMLLPALAIDADGVRLGQGGGWYDRAIAALRLTSPDLVLIGCVPSQRFVVSGVIPREDHDVTVDYVVTEHGWARCGLVPSSDNPQGQISS
ncbi:MAG: 5-formyltetrahydrofolate cyclo-ligase [Actinomycetaceae bacterium]|nr:5-formyltetrahydrofolate cyclo-ligase [Actinomycetaceae bacterium]